jgi:CheY-like chemotaxis protein
MNQVRSRVRHAQCLATRLGFTQDELNRVVLAAWLSGIDERRSVVKQFETPYDLEPVIYPPPGGKPQPREVLALSLVRCYETLARSDRDAARDVNRTRRHLQLAWSSASEQQEMIETFLQILIDERFFANLDRTAGRVLLVGDSGAAPSSAVLLGNSGYAVHAVPSAEAAKAAVSSDRPDLAVVCFDLPDGSGLDLCRALKAGDQTRGMPVLMLLPPTGAGRAAEVLRAGADDFLVQPADRELLLLKLEKLAERKPHDAQKTGVSGSLADLSFTDMIQILCAGGRNIEISLTRGDEEGRVFVKGGAVVHATCGAMEGEDAFFSLMRWCEGEFTTRECRRFPGETISCSAMSLLMEGARRVDEQEPES